MSIHADNTVEIYQYNNCHIISIMINGVMSSSVFEYVHKGAAPTASSVDSQANVVVVSS